MRIIVPGILLSFFGILHPSWAQDTSQDETSPMSTAESSEITKNVYSKAWNLTPRFGVIGYQDGNLNYTSRALGGMTTNINLASVLPFTNLWNIGLETGLLYTHAGSAGSNFFGTNVAGSGVSTGSNSFIVPINLSLGYQIMDNLFFAVNAGPQLIYRSVPSTMHFGRDSDLASANQIDFFPGLGANIGWEVSKNVALSLRGDFIPTPSIGMFTTTLGATVGIS